MALSEQQYIMLCKKQIEEKYSLCNRDGYMNRDLEILSREKAEIGINGKVAFNEVFKEDFGKVKGLIYLFDGTGSIDYVKLTGADRQIVFEDNFDKQ